MLFASVVFAVLALLALLPFRLNPYAAQAFGAMQQETLQQQRMARVLALLYEAESGERAYVITGGQAFLAAALQARQALAPALRELKEASGSGTARARAWRIARLAELKAVEIDDALAARRQAGFAAAQAVVAAPRGRDHMDELRRLVGLENARLAQRRAAGQAELAACAAQSAAMGAAAALLGAVLLGALLLMLLRRLRARERRAHALDAEAAQLRAAADLAARRNRELKLIAAMLRAVDAAPSAAEAAPLVGRYAARLMPGLTGSVFLLHEDGALRRHAQWGDGAGYPAEMALEDCRALRHDGRRETGADAGRHAGVDAGNGAGSDMRGGGAADGTCGGAAGCRPPCCAQRGAAVPDADGAAGRACLPLVSHEELVGMMLVRGLSPDPRQHEQQVRLAQAVAEQLALALGSAKLRASLRRQSALDALTGLYNRRHFDETLARELARARRKAAPLSLLVLDIDHFKQVNDRYGHAAGDAVLRTIARYIRAWGREGDVACRYGGEEFVMLLPECAVEAAALRADALRRAIESMPASPEGGGPERVTASIGVAAWPLQGDAADALFWAADKALYRAKQQGRNQVAVAGAAA